MHFGSFPRQTDLFMFLVIVLCHLPSRHAALSGKSTVWHITKTLPADPRSILSPDFFEPGPARAAANASELWTVVGDPRLFG